MQLRVRFRRPQRVRRHSHRRRRTRHQLLARHRTTTTARRNVATPTTLTTPTTPTMASTRRATTDHAAPNFLTRTCFSPCSEAVDDGSASWARSTEGLTIVYYEMMTERWLCGAPTGCHVLGHCHDHARSRLPRHRRRQWRPVGERSSRTRRGQADRVRRRIRRAPQFDDQLHAGHRPSDRQFPTSSRGDGLDEVARGDCRRTTHHRPGGRAATRGACRHAHRAGRPSPSNRIAGLVGGDGTRLHNDCRADPCCRTLASSYARRANGFDSVPGFHEHDGATHELDPAARCPNSLGLASWPTDPADPTRMPPTPIGRQRSLELR